MKYLPVILLSFFLEIIAAAVPSSSNGGTLLLPFTRNSNRKLSNDYDKRDINLPVSYHIVSYTVILEVGTPGQKIEFTLDTGSSDMWMYSNGTNKAVTFNPSKSSSFNLISHNFHAGYLLGGGSSGDWVTDDVSIGNTVVKSQQMGLAYNGTIPEGVLGIGMQNLEVSSAKYDNLPISLVKQGIISSNIYSLYLNSADASSGSILFGGVDHSKYVGDLFEVPLVDNYRFTVNVTIQGAGSEFQAVLDSGTSNIYVPRDVLQSVGEALGGRYVGKHGVYVLDEIPVKEVILDFGGGEIKISASALIITGPEAGLDDQKYVLTMHETVNGENILGDSFLRSVYAVFDLDNKKVSLAQALNSSGNSSVSSSAPVTSNTPVSSSTLVSSSTPVITSTSASSTPEHGNNGHGQGNNGHHGHSNDGHGHGNNGNHGHGNNGDHGHGNNGHGDNGNSGHGNNGNSGHGDSAGQGKGGVCRVQVVLQ